MRIFKKIVKGGSAVINALAQSEAHHNPDKVITPGMPELLRSVAAQGAVLLENRVLPLESGTKISIFGRVQIDWFATGYGSGGDVNTPYIVNLLEALRRAGATFEEQTQNKTGGITKQDMVALGLSGGKDSSAKRLALQKKLGFPEKMSANALLQALDLLYTIEELTEILKSLEQNNG